MIELIRNRCWKDKVKSMNHFHSIYINI